MNHLRFPLAAATLVAALAGQSTAIFPSEYSNVAEGPLNSANLPLAYGASRVQCLYDHRDLDIPAGHQITQLGFRQDGTLTTMDTGRTLQLEIRMGYSSNTYATMVSNFDNNYTAPPVTVFGPAAFTLPNLRQAANPLPNGQFFIQLTTPFTYNPGNDNLVVEYRVVGTSGGSGSFSYRLDRADYYSPTAQGPAGCQHSGGGPPVLSIQPVRPGQSYSSSLSAAPGNSFAVFLLVPYGQLVTPYPLGGLIPGIGATCMGQLPPVNPTVISAVTASNGSRSISFSIPNNQEMFGHVFIASQAAIFDFFSPGGVVVSNGAQVELGRQPRSTMVYAAGPPTSLTTGTVSRNNCPVAFFTHQ